MQCLLPQMATDTFACCAQSDPFKTLFVSRLSYDVNDKKLRKDFEEFGPVRSIKVVQDKSGEPPAAVRGNRQRGGWRLNPAKRTPIGSADCCILHYLPSSNDQGTIHAGKSRGYGFIEFEHKKDMKEAYKQADGRKIEGRRVVVDVERGRTVENW